MIGTFSLVALVAPGGVGWFLYLFLVPFYAAFPTAMFPPYGGIVAAGAWLILFPIVRTLPDTPRRARSSASGTAGCRSRAQGVAAAAGGSGGGFSGGGSGGGGGGFSGGGGSSGGGGASSSW